jgi:signal transduction histidine kinase
MSVSKSASLSLPAVAEPEHWNSHNHADHVVHFYSDENFLLDPLSRFVGTALGAGDGAVVIARQSLLQALTLRLKANGLDSLCAARQGRFAALEASETLAKFMIDGMPDARLFVSAVGSVIAKVQAALKTGNNHVAAFGEMVAILWESGNPKAAVRLEQLWNALAKQHRFSLHCAYAMKGFDLEEHSEPFRQICAEHTAVIPDESYTKLASEDQRLRDIARLQQRDQMYGALRRTKDQLEKEVAARFQAEQRLRQSEESLRALSNNLLRTQDEERRRLGRELHDSVGQYLAAMKMSLNLAKFHLLANAANADQQLGECSQLVEEAMKEIRTISYLLYPPMLEEMGLRTAVEWFLQGFEERSGIKVTLELPADLGRLPREIELCVFRVLQEGLTNVHRHSGSPTAHIHVSVHEGLVRVDIEDQGKGIHPEVLSRAQGTTGMLGVGLRGMSERVFQLGGRLDFCSTDKGTTLTATLPSAGEPLPAFAS